MIPQNLRCVIIVCSTLEMGCSPSEYVIRYKQLIQMSNALAETVQIVVQVQVIAVRKYSCPCKVPTLLQCAKTLH